MASATEQRSKAVENYRQLVTKVDEKSSAISRHHSAKMRCTKGCHSCCLPGLTVNALEAFVISVWLSQKPEIAEKIKDLAEKNPHQGGRCRLLDEEGACTIYEVRPLVCRSHGLPLKFQKNGEEIRDVCPLNFMGDVSKLSSDEVINMDLLNTILAIITEQWGAGEHRYSLESITPAFV